MVARSPPKSDGSTTKNESPTRVLMNEYSKTLQVTEKRVDLLIARMLDIQHTVECGKRYSARTKGCTPTNSNFKHENSMSQTSTKVLANGKRVMEGRSSFETPHRSLAANQFSSWHWKRLSCTTAEVQKALNDILEAGTELARVKDCRSPEREGDPSKASGEMEPEEISSKDTGGHNKCLGMPQIGRFSLDSQETRKMKDKKKMTILTPPTKKQLSLIGHFQEEGSNYFESLAKEFEQLMHQNSSPKPVHKFRLVTPESKVKALCHERAVSSLEVRRKTEKQTIRASKRADMGNGSPKARCQMSFCCTGSGNANVSFCCCTTKLPMTAEHLTPSKKLWSSKGKSKAVMFPNPTFVPAAADDIQHGQRKKLSPSKAANDTRRSPLFKDKENEPNGKKSDMLNSNFKLGSSKNNKNSSLAEATPKPKKRSPTKIPVRTPMRTPLRHLKHHLGSHKAEAVVPNPRKNTAVPSSFVKRLTTNASSSPHKTGFKMPASSKLTLVSSPLKNKQNRPHNSFNHFKAESINQAPAPSLTKSTFSKSSNIVAKDIAKKPSKAHNSAIASDNSVRSSAMKSLPSLVSKLPSKKNVTPGAFTNAQFDRKELNLEDNEKRITASAVVPVHLPPAIEMKKHNVLSRVTKSRSISCPKQRPPEAASSNLLASPAYVLNSKNQQLQEGKENKNHEHHLRSSFAAHGYPTLPIRNASQNNKDKRLQQNVQQNVLVRSLSIGHDNITAPLSKESRHSEINISAFLKHMKGFIRTTHKD